MKNQIVVLLLLFMMLQSCVVYHEPVTSLEAAKDRGKVKVLYKDGQQSKFTNIVIVDSLYVGLVVTRTRIGDPDGVYKYVWVQKSIPISDNDVLQVFVKDRKKSIVGTVGLIFGTLGALALTSFIVILIDFGILQQ